MRTDSFHAIQYLVVEYFSALSQRIVLKDRKQIPFYNFVSFFIQMGSIWLCTFSQQSFAVV